MQSLSNAAVQDSDASIASRISELVAKEDVQLPPLPEVAMKIQEVLASDAPDMRELGALLTQDPAIAAALLRIANSAAFGGLGRIENLTAAVQRIGTRQVGAIVTGLCLKGHFEHPSPEKREILSILWDHSVTSAFAAREIAHRISANAERAFLCGLLHDCGKVLVLAAVDHMEREESADAASRELMAELMEELHGELGYSVLLAWNFPVEVAEIARRHGNVSERADDLLLCVQAANLITRKLGFHLDPDEELPIIGDPVIQALGLDDLTVATMMIDMEDHLREMKKLF